MFRYDLNGMSPEQFAKLCNALLIATVSDRLRPFDTVGPDAGRDADYEGPGTGAYANIDGYWVFQYKHHDVSRLGIKKSRELIRTDFTNTLDKLFVPGRKAVDNLILITNVPFSGVVNTGTHDWFQSLVANHPLKYSEIWDYTKLEALIDANYDIARSFFPELTYDSRFFKQIADRISSHVFWEGLEALFRLSVDSPPVFASRDEYQSTKELLWDIYESLSLVESGFATISNYVISWPEFTKMVRIAIQNPEYEIHLGEYELIKHGSGAGGGSRNIWHVMRTLMTRIDHHSSQAHRHILELAERHRGVARIIASEAREEFQASDAIKLFRSPDTLITPLQFIRFESVETALAALDRLVTVEEAGHDGSLEGAWEATQAFHNAILVTTAIRKGVRAALKTIDESLVLRK